MEQRKKAFNWQAAVVLLLVLVNLLLWLLFARSQAAADETEETHRSIQQLYVLTEGLGDLEPMMEIMTVHGSIQYYTDDTDWLYFEQMAGSLSITLGTDMQSADYQTYEKNGIQYTCVTEQLGSELLWEDENGYMFYLYASLDAERLLEIAGGIALRPEGADA